MATGRPSLPAQPENCLRTSQLRFTRRAPDVPPCLVSDTEGAALVSVTLLRLTGGAWGAGGGTDGMAGGCIAGGGGAGVVIGGATGGAPGPGAAAAFWGSSTVMP